MIKPSLIAISGPTASGKTQWAIQLAKEINAEIISYDSRQIYRELNIGVARPSVEELEQVKHHFIAHKSIYDSYSVQNFISDVCDLIQKNKQQNFILVGGTGFYLNALFQGLDDLPDISEKTRLQIQEAYNKYGLEQLQSQVREIDPQAYSTLDILNPRRLQRILEIWTEHKLVYSSLVKSQKNQVELEEIFNVKNIVFDIPRTDLYKRINERVDIMIQVGLLQEVQELIPARQLNALQTVGYKELFDYFDGAVSIEDAIEKIKQHTRNYAKRQITWNKKYRQDALWLHPQEDNTLTKIMSYVHS